MKNAFKVVLRWGKSLKLAENVSFNDVMIIFTVFISNASIISFTAYISYTL